MGYGGYDGSAHKKLNEARAALPQQEVFKSKGLHPDMNPFGVNVRESRDSPAHPNSIAIMYMLDETGSMGSIPNDIARNQLPHFMQDVLDLGEPDPQILFGGIGDARNHEESPLQVGQFESEADKMDKWLTAIHLERNGGSNGCESYELAVYFAARHTSIDCYEKRGRKGYLFVNGDETHFDEVLARDIKERIGTDIGQNIPFRDIVAEAQKMYHVFYLIPDKSRAGRCEAQWRQTLGDNVIVQETWEDTCLVASTLIGITEGRYENLEAVGARLIALGKSQVQVGRIIRTVTSYAASIDRAGQERPAVDGNLPGTKGKGRKKRT